LIGNKLVNIFRVKWRKRRLIVRAGQDYYKISELKLGIGSPFPDEEDRVFFRIDREA